MERDNGAMCEWATNSKGISVASASAPCHVSRESERDDRERETEKGERGCGGVRVWIQPCRAVRERHVTFD